MAGFSPQELRRVRRLLHEAVLKEVVWDRTLGTFVARFHCQRRHVDGSEVADPTVEFRLIGARALAVAYDSAFPECRPSQFKPPKRITEDDLAEWLFRSQEAELWINSFVTDDALASARLDWLAGDEPLLRGAGCAFCLVFNQWTDFGLPVIHVHLLIGGDSFTISSGDAPLALDEWEKQFEAWWSGWERHWQTKRDREEAEGEPTEYDTAIPAREDEAVDLSYVPPAEPVFALEPTDAPPEVLRPVRDWFESRHAKDWTRLARAYPHPDESLEERAVQLRDWGTGHDFGRWGYARSVDDWWVEGSRACVMMRGVEHTMPSEGDPEENQETVWTFGLRQRGGDWTIDTYSQGWPKFGSASKLASRKKPWLSRWKTGQVT